MDETMPTVEGAPPRSERLPRGTAIGRYVVLGAIGSGGVGEVYAAFDPQLDRKVAIKLVRADTGDSVDVTEAHARMQREAQAMARLSHPNVVAVHDVGTFENDVFVAMELIEGTTLKRWLAEKPRPWREVRDIFVDAARGLASAHAAGLIHRDFKPENVMIGVDGRVRVLDFGLARPSLRSELPSGPRPLADTPVGGVSTLGTEITRTGTLLGTPAYMSPEQHLRLATDARSDQFSFCVALYEGLYGERPFAGDTIEQLGMATLTGKLAEPPKGSEVPAWLRAVVVRGLAIEAAARWPAMDALIAALLADPAVRRRRIAVMVGVPLVVIAAAAAGFKWSRSAPSASLVGPAAAQNLALDEGAVGKPPPGWIVAGEPRMFPVDVVDQGCLQGRCARMHATGTLGDNDFGNLMQTIDATRYRGKRVRFRLSYHLDGGPQVFVWVRVDRPEPKLGFDYSTQYEGQSADGWTTREIVGDVAVDAVAINFGVVMFDHGTTLIDSGSFDIVPDTTPLTSDRFVAAPANLDFEAGEPGQPPPGWLVLPQKTAGVTISTDAPHSGAHCAKAAGAGASPTMVQRFDATPWRGKHLHITAWGRDVPEGMMDVGVEAGDDSVIVEDTRPATGSAGDWRAFTVDVDVPKTARVVQLAFYADAHTTMYLDDVAIEAR